MKSKIMMGALAVAMLAGMAWAQAPAKNSKNTKTTSKAAATEMHTRVASGSVVSVDENKLVISHKVKGKSQEAAFNLTPETHKMGDLKTGAKATVHYKVENGANVATDVRAKS